MFAIGGVVKCLSSKSYFVHTAHAPILDEGISDTMVMQYLSVCSHFSNSFNIEFSAVSY